MCSEPIPWQRPALDPGEVLRRKLEDDPQVIGSEGFLGGSTYQWKGRLPSFLIFWDKLLYPTPESFDEARRAIVGNRRRKPAVKPALDLEDTLPEDVVNFIRNHSRTQLLYSSTSDIKPRTTSSSGLRIAFFQNVEDIYSFVQRIRTESDVAWDQDKRVALWFDILDETMRNQIGERNVHPGAIAVAMAQVVSGLAFGQNFYSKTHADRPRISYVTSGQVTRGPATGASASASISGLLNPKS